MELCSQSSSTIGIPYLSAFWICGQKQPNGVAENNKRGRGRGALKKGPMHCLRPASHKHDPRQRDRVEW